MRPIVLVHGSFHGGWCWKKVAPTLRAAGHRVLTPTLTGLGERSHLVHPRVGLHTHVEDVVQCFMYEDLTDAVLVGHSYGGMVITGVAEEVTDRLSRLVYLDGFIPEDGKAAVDLMPGAREARRRRATEEGFGWLLAPNDPAERYGVEDEADLAWMRERLTAHPNRTHLEELTVSADGAPSLPRSYIACRQYDAFTHMAERARDGDFDYHELDTGHDAMVTMPEALSSILLDIAA